MEEDYEKVPRKLSRQSESYDSNRVHLLPIKGDQGKVIARSRKGNVESEKGLSLIPFLQYTSNNSNFKVTNGYCLSLKMWDLLVYLVVQPLEEKCNLLELQKVTNFLFCHNYIKIQRHHLV